MNETIFDIKEPLPIVILIIPLEHRELKIFGTMNIIIPDIKLYLASNSDITTNELTNIPINVKGISVLSGDKHYLFNNFTKTHIITTSNLFVTSYYEGIKIETQSNN